MAFISEIHYRNSVAQSTGVAEFIEVSVAPADLTRLSDFTVATYQDTGTVSAVFNLGNLTGTVDPATGWTIFRIATPVTDPDHLSGAGDAEALALIDAAARPPVTTFLDIGGGTRTITAVDGPAAGATSVNIPPATGQSIQFDIHGTRIDGTLTEGSSVVCLTGGTLIATPRGDCPIDDLVVGDLVDTWNGTAQPIRMIHRRTLSGPDLRADPKLRPVCIQAGALGFGLPRRPLRVSPQHRMLYQHIRVPLLFGEEAVFVRAKSLAASFEDVCVDGTVEEVTYFHLVFDRHEVIFAEGAATESFHPGAEGVANLSPEARAELYAIFPRLRVGSRSHDAAFTTLRSWELMACVA